MGRGRPRKSLPDAPKPAQPGRRGRPRKSQQPENTTPLAVSSAESEEGHSDVESDSEADQSRDGGTRWKGQPQKDDKQETSSEQSVDLFNVLKNTIAMREALAKERKSWHGSERTHSPASSHSSQVRRTSGRAEHSDAEVEGSDSQTEPSTFGRGRGSRSGHVTPAQQAATAGSSTSPGGVKRRGRPRKNPVPEQTDTETEQSAVSDIEDSPASRANRTRRARNPDNAEMPPRGSRRRSQVQPQPDATETAILKYAPIAMETTSASGSPPVKRGRGRPRKYLKPEDLPPPSVGIAQGEEEEEEEGEIIYSPEDNIPDERFQAADVDISISDQPLVKRRRGRPRKNPPPEHIPPPVAMDDAAPEEADSVAEEYADVEMYVDTGADADVELTFSQDESIVHEEVDPNECILVGDLSQAEDQEESKLVFGSEPIEELEDSMDTSIDNSDNHIMGIKEDDAAVETAPEVLQPAAPVVQKRGRGRPKKKTRHRSLSSKATTEADPASVAADVTDEQGIVETRMRNTGDMTLDTEAGTVTVKRGRGRPALRREDRDHTKETQDASSTLISGIEVEKEAGLEVTGRMLGHSSVGHAKEEVLARAAGKTPAETGVVDADLHLKDGRGAHSGDSKDDIDAQVKPELTTPVEADSTPETADVKPDTDGGEFGGNEVEKQTTIGEIDNMADDASRTTGSPSVESTSSAGASASQGKKRFKKRSEIELLADVDGPPSKLAKLRNPPSKNIYQRTVEEAARSAQKEVQAEKAEAGKRMTTRGKRISVAHLFAKSSYIDDFIDTDEAIRESERAAKLAAATSSGPVMSRTTPVVNRSPRPQLIQTKDSITRTRSPNSKPTPARTSPAQSVSKVSPAVLPVKIQASPRASPAKVTPVQRQVSPVKSRGASPAGPHQTPPIGATPAKPYTTPVKTEQTPGSDVPVSPLTIEDKISMCKPCKVMLIDFIKVLNMLKEGTQSPEAAGILSPGRADVQEEGNESDATSVLSPQKSPISSPKIKSPKIQASSPFESQFLSFVEATEAKMARSPPKAKAVQALNFSQIGSPESSQQSVNASVNQIPTTQIQVPRKATARKRGATARKTFSGPKKSPGEKYRCLHCSYTNNTRTVMQEHIYNHTDIVPYSCGHCQAIFGTRSGVIIHTKREHPGFTHNVIKNSELVEEEYYTTVGEYQARFGDTDAGYTMPPMYSGKAAGRKRKSSTEPEATYTIVTQPTENAGQIPKLTISRTLVKTNTPGEKLDTKTGQQFTYKVTTTPSKTVKAVQHRARIPEVRSAPDPTKPYFQCKHCTFAGTQEEEMEEHSLHNHGEERRYVCPLCDMAYCKYEDAMRRHYQKWHPGQPVVLKYEPDFYNVGNIGTEEFESRARSNKRTPSEVFPTLASTLSVSSTRGASPASSHSSQGTDLSQERLEVPGARSRSSSPRDGPGKKPLTVILKVPTFKSGSEGGGSSQGSPGSSGHGEALQETNIIEGMDKDENPFEIKIVNVCSLAEEDKGDDLVKRSQYSCKYCDKTSLLFDVMLHHVHKEHKKEYWYACPYCPFASAAANIGQKGSIYMHMRTAHPANPVEGMHIGIVDQENYFLTSRVSVTQAQIDQEEMEAEEQGIGICELSSDSPEEIGAPVAKGTSKKDSKPPEAPVAKEKPVKAPHVVEKPVIKADEDEDDVIIVAQDSPKKSVARPVGPVKPMQSVVAPYREEQAEMVIDLSTRGQGGGRVLGVQAPVGRFSPPAVRPPSQAVRGIPNPAPNVTVGLPGQAPKPPPLLPLGAMDTAAVPEKRRLQVPPLIRAPVVPSSSTAAASAAAQMAVSAAQEQRLAHVAPRLAHSSAQPTSAVRPMPQLQPREQSPAQPPLPRSPEAEEDEEAVKRAFSVFNLAPRLRAPRPPVERPPPPVMAPCLPMAPPPQSHYPQTPILRQPIIPQAQAPMIRRPSPLPPGPPVSRSSPPGAKNEINKWKQFNVRPRPPRIPGPRVPLPAHTGNLRTPSPRENTHRCPYCPARLPDRDSLHDHILGHEPNIHWTCPYCTVPNQMTKAFVEKHINHCHPGQKIVFVPFGVK